MSLNLYTYCLSNPHKYTDPSGHFAITAGIVIGAIIWGLVGAGIEYKIQKDAGGIIDYNHVIFQGTLNMAIAVISGGTANGMMAAQQGTRMTARTFGRMMLMEAGFGVAEGIIGETGYQLIEGKKLKDLNAGKIAVSGAMGGVSGVGGALAGEAIGAGLRALKNTRVVSKAINTMQDMASRGKNAIRRGVDKLADFGRHQLGLDSVAYVTPEGFVVRGPRVPDNGMRLFEGSGSDGMPSGKAYRGGSESNYIIFNKTHVNAQPQPRGTGPNGGRLQSHHGLQKEWAKSNLSKYGYDEKLAPTITIETGKEVPYPHTIISNAQNARRDARLASGQGRWSTSLQDELSYIVTDLRSAGFSDSTIGKVLQQQYSMLDKLKVPYERIKY